MARRVVVEGALGFEVLSDRFAVDVTQTGKRIDTVDTVPMVCYGIPRRPRGPVVSSHVREPTPSRW